MMKRLVFTFALITQLTACGSEPTAVTTQSPGPSPQPARYPRSMPASTLDDTRLIGYWETPCAASDKDSQRWTFLLDPSKAVLEKKVFRDGHCSEAAYSLRYYLNYSTAGETLNAALWEEHANFQSSDRLSQLFDLQNCSLPQVREEIWYDLTGTGCTKLDRGSPVLKSHYAFSLDQRLVLSIDSQTPLKFTRMD